MILSETYKISQLVDYIDWSYFFHAWQMPVRYASLGHLHDCEACRQGWLAAQGDNKDSAIEAMRLMDDARLMLLSLEQKGVEVSVRVGLFKANSVGDDIMVVSQEGGEVCIPCLRQQKVVEGEYNKCIADFIRPKEMGEADTIGIFATTVKFDPDEEFGTDAYRKMLSQTLCDRLAEASACVLHQKVRKDIWGYAPEEKLTIEDMLRERNQGIRPAVGYPSMPDQSLNFILSDLINMSDMGISLTENGMMVPHASVSGLMISHPKADYFMVGIIDEQQLSDYAQRRRLPLDKMKTFLAANLN